MAFDFNDVSDIGGEAKEALPKGTLAWAKIVDVNITTSKSSGNDMAVYTYELLGIHEGRTQLRYENMVFGGINKKGVENVKQAGGRVKAMLLTSKKPMNAFPDFKAAIQATIGCVVGIKLALKDPDKEGRVFNELWGEVSPDTESRTHKDYLKLVAEQGEPPLASVPQVVSVDSIDTDEIPF